MDTARILVADDVQSMLELCSDILGCEGHQVHMASSGQEALDRLETEYFDLLLVDLNMPDLDGLEVMKRARELDPNLVVVVVTGYVTMENAIEALRAGARGFLPKPFDPDELVQAIADALEVRRREQETLFLRARLPILEIGQTLMAEGDITSIPGQLLGAVVEQVGADRACLVLLAEEENELYISEVIGLPRDAVEEIRIPAGQGFAKKVLWQEEPLVLNEKEILEPICQALSLGSVATVACVRLRTRERTMGMICLGRLATDAVFTPPDLYLLSIIGGQIAIALENAHFYEAFHQSEARFRQFFENEPEYCYIVSPEGKILDVNKAVIESLGYSKDELVGQPLTTVYAPESLRDAERLFVRWVETGELKNEEILITTEAGEVRTVLLSTGTVRDRNGEVLHSVSVQRDVTERKQAEKELRRQNEYLASLHEIGLGLITRRELTELLAAIVERVGALLGTPHGFIYLVAPDGDTIELHVGAGAYTQHVGYRLKPDEGLAGKVWRTGQSLVVDDYSLWPARVDYVGFDIMHYVVGVPLISGSQVVGVLGLAHVEAGLEFRFEEIALLSQFAELASIALDNARLYEQAQQEIAERKQAEQALERRAIQLALLSEIGSKISAVSELDSVLETAATLVQESFGYHHVALFILDSEQGELWMRAKAGLFTELFPPDHHLALDQGMVGWAGRHGETVWANDVNAEPRYVNLYPDMISSHSELSVPIQMGGEVLGVLDVQSPQPNAFDGNDVMVMEILADQISVVIDNARLYEQAQREIAERRQAQAALQLQRDLAVTLGSTKDLPEALNQVLHGFFQIEGIDCGGVYLVDGKTKELDLVVHKGLNSKFVEAVSHYAADSPQAQLVMAGHPIHQHYSQILTGAKDGVRTSEALRAITVMPVSYQGRVIAALNLGSHRHDELSANTRNVIEATASQIGGVIGRVMAEEALRESEQRFRGIVEHSSDAIVLTDERGSIVSWNQGAVRITGLEPAEVLGRPLWDVQFQTLPVEHKTQTVYERLQAMLLEAFETGKALWLGQLMEMEIERPNGARRTIQTVGFTVETEQGFRSGSVIRDITERKLAEEALRESEEQFRLLFEHAPIGMAISDLDGRYLRVNQAHCDTLGYTVEEMLTRKYADLTPPEDAAVNVALRERTLRGEIPHFQMEKRFITKSGEIVHTLLQVTLIRDTQGQPLYFVGQIVDITERTRAEEALRLTQFAVDRASDPVFWMGPDANFIYVNDAACRNLGYSRQELLNMTVHDIDPNFPVAVWPDHWQEIKERGAFAFESHHQAKDGRAFPVEIAVNFVEFEDREYNCAFARDITERKQAEEALRQSEAKYRNFVEQSHEGVWEIDHDGMTVFANSRMAQILGYGSPKQMMGRKLHEFAPRAYTDISLPAIEQHRDGTVEIQDCTLQKEDGAIVHGILSHLPHFDEAGHFAGSTIFITDITDRKQAEEALRESEHRYRTLFESAGDAIFIHDLVGQFLAVNHLACERLGYSQNELLRMTRRDVEVSEYAVLIPERIEAVRRYGQGLSQTVHMRQNGTTIPIELSCRLIEYEGRPAVLCIARDLTERKRMEQYVLRTERLAAMGHLAAALAHEINNPLQSIGSSIELVLDFPLEEEERLEYMEAVRQEIERLMTLTNRVLDFARPPKLERHPVSVAEVVHHALSLAGKQLMHSRIGVQADLPDDLPSVPASRDQLAQVFLNLILNAVEAMPDGGRLSISARAIDGQIVLDFQDSGPGLQTDAAEKVFEPFYTTKEEGTGLGLAVSYSIVQQHGGTIIADSAPEGGALFTIILPVAVSAGF